MHLLVVCYLVKLQDFVLHLGWKTRFYTHTISNEKEHGLVYFNVYSFCKEHEKFVDLVCSVSDMNFRSASL